MGGRTGHVGVLPGRQVESLDDAKFGQQVERPEQGRPADVEPPLAGRELELRRREMAIVPGDQVGDRAARARHAIPAGAECLDDGIGADHRRTIADFGATVAIQSHLREPTVSERPRLRDIVSIVARCRLLIGREQARAPRRSTGNRYPHDVLRRVPHRQVLTMLVGLALLGLAFLIPDLSPDVRTENETVQAFRGRIESIQQPPVDQDPETPPVPIAKVRLLDGPQAGQIVDAYLAGPGGSQSIASYQPNDEVVVTISDGPTGTAPFIAVSDHWRIPALIVLGLVFAAAVILVGGWHGVRALIALGLTVAVLLKILLPLLIAGFAPVPLAVLSASGVTIATILLTEGLKRSSVAAILGTTGALALTGLLAALATAAMGFTYSAGSDLAFLTTPNGLGLDLRGVLLAAFILGAIGVLDDVTVTQAVLVQELADRGGLRGSNLVASGMVIGRSHIAATVNTLFLAYVGAGLPLLIILIVSRQPGAIVLNDETFATEIVRTLIGSLGIVAAVPLTTLIAASLVPRPVADRGTGRRTLGGPNAPAAAAGAVIVALLVATAVLPLTPGPRPALTPDPFDPGNIPGASASPDASVGLETPDPPATGPNVVNAGVPALIAAGGAELGTITVNRWTFDPEPSPGTEQAVVVEVSYLATAPFPLASGRWELLLPDGTEIPLEPEDGTVVDRTLATGESLDATLRATAPADATDMFVIYVDTASANFVVAVPIE